MYTFIELFAGIGGFRSALEATGYFRCLYANDIDSTCATVYNLNFQEPKLHVADIYNVDIHTLPKVDLVVAGFPCQAFSVAGKRQGFSDERGQVFFRLAQIIEYLSPSMILLENVKNLQTHDKGQTFRTICATLEKLGYVLHSKVLNTMIHTYIPQNRERIFIVGFRDSRNFEFPNEEKELQPFRQLLESNVDAKFHYTQRMSIYKELADNVTDPNSVYQWRRHYVRQNKKHVVPTLTCNMGTGGHNVPIILDESVIRKLTPRECFRFQGFPDSFKLPDIALSKLYKLIGNSVSVPLIQKIVECIIASRN